MTTLVVVAVDDFALRVENDHPETPEWLLHTALAVQKKMREAEPTIRLAICDMMIFGATAYVPSWE